MEPGILFNRRTLLASAALSQLAIRGANDKIRVANVGCGRRGLLKELMQIKDDANIEVAAVCDIWRQRREKAAADVKEFTGKAPDQVAEFAKVLARKDIDAVVIGTPDHLHCTMLIEAIKAGKDVYVEKPLAMNMKELIAAYDAVKKSDRVVQVGTQMRSYPQSAGARQIITSGGIGKILKVEQVRNGYKPYWMSYGSKEFADMELTEADTDWKAFLGPRKNRPFDADQYRGWFGYRDFSSGPHTNLMAHFIDMVHFATDAKFPKRAVALGGTYLWKEKFDAPDSVEVAFDYAEGFIVRYTSMFGNSAGNLAKWYGTRGTLDAKNLGAKAHWTISGEGSGEPDKLKAESQVPENEPVHHMKNWIDSVRSRKDPIAPIDAAYGHSVACIMAEESMVTGKRLVYDHSKRALHAG